MINKTIMKLMGVVVMLFAFAQASNAMTIEVRTYGNSNGQYISAYGTIEKADIQKLKAIVNKYPSLKIVLNSGGGNVWSAEQMAKIIRSKGMTTVVHSKSICASACGIVFMGGTERLIWNRTKTIGFHAFSKPYDNYTGEQLYLSGQRAGVRLLSDYMKYSTPGKERRLVRLFVRLYQRSDIKTMKYPNPQTLLNAGIATKIIY